MLTKPAPSDMPISPEAAIPRSEQYQRCPVLRLGSLAVRATSWPMNTRRFCSAGLEAVQELRERG